MSSDTVNVNLEKAVVVIPALNPDKRLTEFVCKLLETGFGYIVVVDDGSDSEYQYAFRDIEKLQNVAVIHHEKNCGKGIALKTAFNHIYNVLKEYAGVITADADGQHTVVDCKKLAEMMLSEGDKALYLGSRDFSKKDVPALRRIANIATSIVFRILFGQWLKDGQTGLRAFPISLLPMMTKVEGERYEYEMSMLIACRQSKIPIKSMDIETIYENNNETSHINTLKDTARIAKVMAWNFIKFMGSSLITTLLEWGVFSFLRYSILPNSGFVKDGSDSLFGMDMISTIIGRIVSATANYILNRKIVFKDKGTVASSLWKYIVLCICVAAVSGGCVYLLELIHVPAILAKILIDTILYFVNYRIQKSWVFNENEMSVSD